jgi:hypothetical protein
MTIRSRPSPTASRREWRRSGVAGAVLLAAAGLLAGQAASAIDSPIGVSVAALFVGEEKIVEGVVTAVERDTHVVKLRLGTPPQSLTVSLIMGLLTRFPSNAEVYYAGKNVLVAGTIKKFRDDLEMTIRDPANIEVIDSAGSESSIVLREQHDAMRTKLQLLEERIRQLESKDGAPPPPE